MQLRMIFELAGPEACQPVELQSINLQLPILPLSIKYVPDMP